MGTLPVDDDTLKWVEKQEASMKIGEEFIKKASDEAMEYVADALENLHDRQWRKMAMESQAVEMGIGIALAEHLVPVIYKDMEKTLHKKLKIDKEMARGLRHIYIGRVIKNIRKEIK